jgi:hypothetical protein
MKRKLSCLTHGADKKQQSNGGEGRSADEQTILAEHRAKSLIDAGKRNRVGKTLRCEPYRAEGGFDEKDAEQEGRIADAIHDEGFLGGVTRGFVLKVETDQEIAAKTYALPTHKEEQEIVGEDQGEHGKHEEIQVAKETVVAPLSAHVADGVDVNQEPDAGHYENHDARKRIEKIAPISEEWDGTSYGRDWARSEPFEKNLLKHAMAWLKSQESKSRAGGMEEGQRYAAQAEEVDGVFWKEAADEKHQCGCDEGKEWDEPKIVKEVGGGHGLSDAPMESVGSSGDEADKQAAGPITI